MYDLWKSIYLSISLSSQNQRIESNYLIKRRLIIKLCLNVFILYFVCKLLLIKSISDKYLSRMKLIRYKSHEENFLSRMKFYPNKIALFYLSPLILIRYKCHEENFLSCMKFYQLEIALFNLSPLILICYKSHEKIFYRV